jgi:hypothetical protein
MSPAEPNVWFDDTYSVFDPPSPNNTIECVKDGFEHDHVVDIAVAVFLGSADTINTDNIPISATANTRSPELRNMAT